MELAIVALLALIPCGTLAAQNVSMKRRITRLEAVASESPRLELESAPTQRALETSEVRAWALPEELHEPDAYTYEGPPYMSKARFFAAKDDGSHAWSNCYGLLARGVVVRPRGPSDSSPPRYVKTVRDKAEMAQILGEAKA